MAHSTILALGKTTVTITVTFAVAIIDIRSSYYTTTNQSGLKMGIRVAKRKFVPSTIPSEEYDESMKY